MHSKLANGTLPAASRSWDLDLSADNVPDDRFDLIVTVMTLHHVPGLTPVLDAFAELLDDGGHLCVVDLVKEDGSFHSGRDFHGHHGFDTRDLTAQLESAGFTDAHVSGQTDTVIVAYALRTDQQVDGAATLDSFSTTKPVVMQ